MFFKLEMGSKKNNRKKNKQAKSTGDCEPTIVESDQSTSLGQNHNHNAPESTSVLLDPLVEAYVDPDRQHNNGSQGVS